MENAQAQTSPLAIGSLALSCGSVVLGPFGSIPGIILGFMALNEIKRNQNTAGSGLAYTGIILGFLFLAVFAFLAIVIIAGGTGDRPAVYQLEP